MLITDTPTTRQPDSSTAVDEGGPRDKPTHLRGAGSRDQSQPPDADLTLGRNCRGAWTTVYLAGEIHTDWRQQIIAAVREKQLPIRITHPVLDHGSSDDCGVRILGPEQKKHWHDHKGAKVNAIRTRALIGEADIVVARFDGESTYRQWNAAFEAGQAAALGKALIVIHDERSGHALKEVDAAALAVAEDAGQVADILTYVVSGRLPAEGD